MRPPVASPGQACGTAPAHALDERPSKTLATWVAIIGGSLGLHHFYLGGLRSRLGWLYPLPTLAGLYGVQRMRALGQDDHAAWALIPWLGLTISIGMLCAIVIGLTSDARWARRFAPEARAADGTPADADADVGPDPALADEDDTPAPAGMVATGWGPVLGVIVALMLGGTVLMGTIAFSVQKAFEYQLESAARTG